MTRKPDEIMRELNDPIHVHYHHGDREPHMTPLAMADLEQLHADALVLIKRLDRTIIDQEKLAKKIYDQKVGAEERIQQLEAQNAELLEKVEQLQAERDAAVESMRSDPHCCYHCANMTKRGICQSEPRADGHCFEWCGVTKEE